MDSSPLFRPTISNEETAALPAARFSGEIRIVDTNDGIEAACNHLHSQPVIGFDTETRPSFRPGPMNRVALLQLSAPDCCYLFRLCRIRFDKAIIRLLSSPDVLKVGADVANDLRALKQIRHFQEAGFVDLQQHMEPWGITERSLRKMSAIVLGLRVSKAQRLINWEAVRLTPQQQLYAATDAWVCTAIYDRLTRASRLSTQTHTDHATTASPAAPR